MEITIRFNNNAHLGLEVNSEFQIIGYHPKFKGMMLDHFINEEVSTIACPKELVEELEEMFPHINIEMLEV